MNRNLIPLIVAIALGGCVSAARHKEDVQDETTDRVAVGTVQKEIRVGMSGAEVATVLGSPNIVSTDEERREVWIYDKIATDYAYSESKAGGIGALILGTGGSTGAGGVGLYSTNAGATTSSQRTLTVIIKFDEDSAVRDFAYHTSRF